MSLYRSSISFLSKESTQSTQGPLRSQHLRFPTLLLIESFRRKIGFIRLKMQQSSKQALVTRECFCFWSLDAYNTLLNFLIKITPFFAHNASHKIPYILTYCIKHRTKKPSPCIKLTTATKMHLTAFMLF